MSQPINLNRVRKDKARAEKRARADAVSKARLSDRKCAAIERELAFDPFAFVDRDLQALQRLNHFDRNGADPQRNALHIEVR